MYLALDGLVQKAYKHLNINLNQALLPDMTLYENIKWRQPIRGKLVITTVVLAGFLASVVWFIVGGALYMNPLVAGIYKQLEGSPGLKKWADTKTYLINMYLLTLAQCLLFAGVYANIKPIFMGTLFDNGLAFGLILVAVRILPRLFDMWIQTTYPKKLLLIELINGTIGSLVIALVIVSI